MAKDHIYSKNSPRQQKFPTAGPLNTNAKPLNYLSGAQNLKHCPPVIGEGQDDFNYEPKTARKRK